MSVTAGQRLRRVGRALRDQAQPARSRRRALDRACDRRRDVHGEPHARRAGRRVEGAPRARAAAGRRRELGQRERSDRREGRAGRRATAATAAELLDLRPEEVLVLSTGVIGEPLPVAKLLAGLPEAVAGLSADATDAADAILTTDTHAKQAAAHGDGFVVGGMAKGSGMIHPNLATMLAVVTTDYPLEPGEAAEFLRPAVERSFNAISVDGECSTNDTVLLLANGASNVSRDDDAFAAALDEVCSKLAAQIVADGEGATVVAEIGVTGAASAAEAKAIARRIATSPLVKTALHGRDANWGRVLAAAGSAPFNGGYAHLDPSRSRSTSTACACSSTARRAASSRSSPATRSRSRSTSVSVQGTRRT
jgi:N-acetylglutamate synthase/N-acetylornithine aminotransferase